MPLIKFHKLSKNIWKKISELFLKGLFTLLPITLTLGLFNIFLRMISSWLEPLKNVLSNTTLNTIPHAEIIVACIIILFIGTIYNIFILRHIIHGAENAFLRLPLVRPVYSGIKQLVSAFGTHDQLSFKKVVMVEFPRKNLFSVGFLTSELAPEIAPNNREKYFNIFIPTTPNPTSGFCIIVSESEITATDFNRQEAMALIISGGIIQPERPVPD